MFKTSELLVLVPVRDVARATAFYCDVLGCTVAASDDYGAMLDLHGRPVRLARVEDAAPSYTVLGWMVPSIEDAIAALGEAGTAVMRYEGMGQDELGIWAAPSGDRVAWFTDSEDNTLSLTQLG